MNQNLQTQASAQDLEQPKPKTQLDYLLLDGSGSMQGRWTESLDALDKYVATLKMTKTDSKLQMAIFSGSGGLIYDVCRDATVADWRPLALEAPIIPGGLTPLYDAINVMVRSLRDLNPDECAITIVTDGDEQGSHHTTEKQARELLDWCRRRGWQVTFLGCDFNNTRLAKLLGGSSGSAIGAPTKRLADVTRELAKKRMYHATHGTPMNFTDEEKASFGGYLTDNTTTGK